MTVVVAVLAIVATMGLGVLDAPREISSMIDLASLENLLSTDNLSSIEPSMQLADRNE
jgi:hypothetical protein